MVGMSLIFLTSNLPTTQELHLSNVVICQIKALKKKNFLSSSAQDFKSMIMPPHPSFDLPLKQTKITNKSSITFINKLAS